ncbi:MAG: thioesterase family protein, partial [Pseudomonadales bacterium]
PAQPLFSVEASVRREWIDFNGHMNMGFYAVAFDYIGTDNYFAHLGLTEDHFRSEQKSTFTLSMNIDYLKELFEGDRLRFTTQLMDYDHKRLHYFHCMYNLDKSYLAAVNECLTMYVDMLTRRSTTFSDEQLARFAQELEQDSQHGVPDGFGRKLGIRR